MLHTKHKKHDLPQGRLPLQGFNPKGELPNRRRPTQRVHPLQLLPTGKQQGTSGAAMNPNENMGEHEDYCKDCICTEECTNNECIKIGGIKCTRKHNNQ